MLFRTDALSAWGIGGTRGLSAPALAPSQEKRPDMVMRRLVVFRGEGGAASGVFSSFSSAWLIADRLFIWDDGSASSRGRLESL